MLAVVAPHPTVANRSSPRSDEPLARAASGPFEPTALGELGGAPGSASADREATVRATVRTKAAAIRNRELGLGKVRVDSHTAWLKLRHLNKADDWAALTEL